MHPENNQQDAEPADLEVTSTISSNSIQEQEIQNTDPSSKQRASITKKEKRKINSKAVFDLIKFSLSWKVISMALAHHPNCEIFDNHVFKIGKIRLCRGCTLSYPPMYATVLMFVFWFDARDFLTAIGLLIPTLWWFTIGFGIVGALALLLRKHSFLINDIYKFSRGAFAGFLVTIIFSQHWGFKIGAGIVLMGAMALLSIHRGGEMEKTCEECEWKANYEECPGWGDIIQAFNKIQSNFYTYPSSKSSTMLMKEQHKKDEETLKDIQIDDST